MELVPGPDDNGSTARSHVTTAMRLVSQGVSCEEIDLSELLYDDLRRVAGRLLQRERSGHTLQPTALVHEAWMRLVDATSLDGGDVELARRRFLSYAVQAMRRILIDHARARVREKRGGANQRVTLTESMLPGVEDAPQLLDLDSALDELGERKPRAAKIAELRLYGGLSTAEAAEVCDVSLATAKTDWSLAQAYLSRQVRDRS